MMINKSVFSQSKVRKTNLKGFQCKVKAKYAFMCISFSHEMHMVMDISIDV